MKKLSFIVVTAGLLLAMSSQVEAKGCIKGAIVGGVAGHMAHHGVAGAAAGGSEGHHMASQKQKEAEAKQQQPK